MSFAYSSIIIAMCMIPLEPTAAQDGGYAAFNDLSIIPSTNKPTTNKPTPPKSANNGQSAQMDKANPFNQAAQFGSYASIDDLSVIPSTNKPTTTKSVNNGQAAQPNKANPFNQFPSTTRKPNAGNNKDWPMFSNMNQVKPGQPFQMDSPPKNNNGGQKCGTRVKRQSSSVTKDGTHVRVTIEEKPQRNPRRKFQQTPEWGSPSFNQN